MSRVTTRTRKPCVNRSWAKTKKKG